MAVLLPVRVKRTVKISSLQRVNTQSFAPHSSPVIDFCHNIDIVHVILLTLHIHIKLFTDLMFCVLNLCKVQMSSSCLSFRSRAEFLSICRYTNRCTSFFGTFQRVPMCWGRPSSDPTLPSSMSDSGRQLSFLGCSETKISCCMFTEYRSPT